MQEVYMCLEEICQAASRFNVSRRELVKGGNHYGHDCQDLEDIRDNIQSLIQFWSTNTVDYLQTDLDEKCVLMKKACSLLIDQYFAQQKQMIQSNILSSDEFGSRQLTKAVHERDLVFLEEHQYHYQILRKPQLILNKQQEVFDMMKNDITQRYDLIYKSLTQMFSKLVHDNLDDHQVKDQKSPFIIQNLQVLLNQRQKDYDYLFKILLIGTSEVGGFSSIMMRFSDNSFLDAYLTTIGVDFRVRNLDLQGKTLKLQIWDTAGQERFKTITTAYYKGAHGIILTYDITNKSSFEQINNFLTEVENYASENVIRLLVGNKSDLETERQVTFEKGKALADSLGIKFLECSAKNNTNLDEVFMTMAQYIMAKQLSLIPE